MCDHFPIPDFQQQMAHWLFKWHSGHVTACGVLRCAPAERAEEEWSLDAVVSLCCWRSLLAPISNRQLRAGKFRQTIRGIPRRRMELSIGQLCGVLFSLLAGTFSTPIRSILLFEFWWGFLCFFLFFLYRARRRSVRCVVSRW